MGLIKIVLPLIVASFALLACTDAVSASGALEKSPASLNNRLRRSLESSDDMGREERTISLKSVSGLVPFTKAFGTKKAAAVAKQIEERKMAMLNGRLTSVPNSEFTSYFLAGKSIDDIVNVMKSAERSEESIKKSCKAWLKSVLTAKLE
ncbi:hypothetical protein PI124_g9614 [Phytophthora idaei]|nr:hypothetical protein PI125_g10249 [Phytophthora idaei]KAG3154461.1 hypothetical protein PI126_g9614 [Phytophthora idaei]KAG3245645.1 hypothetical protein PI124_g9614 [Phytophthora idaei]